jgi:hypothetical protein
MEFGSLSAYEVDLDQVHARVSVFDEEHLQVFDGRRKDVEWRWGRHSVWKVELLRMVYGSGLVQRHQSGRRKDDFDRTGMI